MKIKSSIPTRLVSVVLSRGATALSKNNSAISVRRSTNDEFLNGSFPSLYRCSKKHSKNIFLYPIYIGSVNILFNS